MACRRLRFGVETKKEKQPGWKVGVEEEEALAVLEKTTRKLWQHVLRLCSAKTSSSIQAAMPPSVLISSIPLMNFAKIAKNTLDANQPF